MYRVLAIVGAGLLVAACSSTGGSLFGPSKETVRFESEPPGAEAKVSTGDACKTPCALPILADKPFSVTFTLIGYQPATQEVQLTSPGAGGSQFRPNPVTATLTVVPPPPKKRRVRQRKPATKPVPKPVATAPRRTVPQPTTPAAVPPMTPAQQPQVSSPWPATPPAQSR